MSNERISKFSKKFCLYESYKVTGLLHTECLSTSVMLLDFLFQLNTYFLTFPACFSIPIIFSNFDFNWSNLSSLRNLQEQVKKVFGYQKLFWPFTAWINCWSQKFWKFLAFSFEFQKFFLNQSHNFGNKIPSLLFWQKNNFWKLNYFDFDLLSKIVACRIVRFWWGAPPRATDNLSKARPQKMTARYFKKK